MDWVSSDTEKKRRLKGLGSVGGCQRPAPRKQILVVNFARQSTGTSIYVPFRSRQAHGLNRNKPMERRFSQCANMN